MSYEKEQRSILRAAFGNKPGRLARDLGEGLPTAADHKRRSRNDLRREIGDGTE
jgi:hypothetical protein